MRKREITFLFASIFLTGCRPRACVHYVPDKTPLGFAAQDIKNISELESWKGELRGKLRELLEAEEFGRRTRIPESVIVSSGSLPALAGEKTERLQIENVSVRSDLDGRMIPAFFVYEKGRAPEDFKEIVVVLHGHGSGGESYLALRPDLTDTILKAAAQGKVVFFPGIRSLGAFGIGKSHWRYHWFKKDGEFLREVLSDASCALRFLKHRFAQTARTTLVGHSLGGYVALHWAALDSGIDRALVSGSFVPYACFNSGMHDGCQRFKSIEAFAELTDVAGLIAPRPLLIHYGERDGHYSPAVDEAAERTRGIFFAAGAPEKFRFVLTPGAGHVLDPDLVSDFVAGEPEEL